MRLPRLHLSDVKNSLLRLWNRQFLTFLFFLLLSASFWFFQAINETYDREFNVPLQLTDIPKNAVITTELPSHLRITLRDRGFMLYRYLYTRRFPTVRVKFDDVATADGHVVLSTADLLKGVVASLESGTQVVSTRPESVEFYYNYGQSKRVPVIVQGRFVPDSTFTLLSVDVEPRMVTVYASKRILDTLSAAYLVPSVVHHLRDSVTTLRRPFVRIPGVKYEPVQATLTLFTDRMVEKTVDVPIHGVNFPGTKTLRTFPAKVKVSFQVGMSRYTKVTADDFVLVVNYADLLNDSDNVCDLSLKSLPSGVRHARISPMSVEYVIEELPSEDEVSEE